MTGIIARLGVARLLVPQVQRMANMSSSAVQNPKLQFNTVSITVPQEFVYHVQLNRPEKLNALNKQLWVDVGNCFQELDSDPDCRVVVLSGNGKLFTAGLDLGGAMEVAAELQAHDDVARKAMIFSRYIRLYQNSISSLELCRKPVLVAVHSACVGAGVDMVTAADMRYCTQDAWFQIKEVDIGMAADVGTLQRLPKVVGNHSWVRDVCYTGRRFNADEALSAGLVSKVYSDKDSMLTDVVKVAAEIAQKSPVAVQGTKVSLNYSRDHTVQEGLDHIAIWNQAMLQSEDFTNATMSQISKQKATFAKL